jgi:predicted metalloendopeptidase
MQRTLLSLAVLAAISAGSTSAAFAQTTTPANTTAATTTTTAARSSGIDLQWIDTSVRPQDDFFKFMSGKWLANAEIPADRARFGSFDQLRDLSEQRSYDIIKALAADSKLKAGSNEKKIADLYNSFMDEAQAEKLDIAPLKATFNRIDRFTKKKICQH